MARSFSKELSDASPLVYHTDSGTLEGQGERRRRRGVAEGDLARRRTSRASASSPTRRTARPPPRRCSRRRRSATCPSMRARRSTRPPRSPSKGSAVSVDAGGQLGTKISKSESKTSELIGIAAAMLILVLVFGTVTAMVLPIAAAIFGLICGLSLVSLLGHLVAVPDVAPTVGAMIGLGVGIDYSLFIVTRARSARHEGMSTVDAIGHAAATSGSRGRVRRHHRGDRAAVAGGVRHHADHRARPGRRDRGRRRRARLDDAAAGAARPLRRPHRAAARRPRQAPDARPQRAAGSAGARASRAARASSPWCPSWCCSRSARRCARSSSGSRTSRARRSRPRRARPTT